MFGIRIHQELNRSTARTEASFCPYLKCRLYVSARNAASEALRRENFLVILLAQEPVRASRRSRMRIRFQLRGFGIFAELDPCSGAARSSEMICKYRAAIVSIIERRCR
jgi:hypothetical protein